LGRARLYYWIDGRALRHYALVICVSDDLIEQCVAAGVSPDRCVLIENAIDTDQYVRQMSIPEARRRLGLRADGLLVGAVGRLSEEKGFDILIRAVGRLINEGCSLELVIAGEGNARPGLEAAIARQRQANRFHLLGHRSDVPVLLQALDIFALSSLREGLPNVLLEAMAMEVACVATRIAGVPRLIEHERNGLLVQSGNEEELCAAIRRLLRSDEERSAYATAGRLTIEQRYSFARRMEKIRALYESVLHESGRGAAAACL
jgi:glycosyltransferase involved in cell wall biosynthesis